MKRITLRISFASALCFIALQSSFASAAPAQNYNAYSDSAIAELSNDTVCKADKIRKREKRKRKLMQLDSIRLKIRESANSGNMLQWADSMLYRNRTLDADDSIRREKRLERLADADEKLSFANNLLTKKYYNKNIDTAYIARPSEPWTIKFRSNISFNLTGIRDKDEGKEVSGFWASRGRYTLSVGATYRGLGLSAAINPAKLAGKNKDMEYQFTSYGNKMGFDVIYEAAKTDRGSITYGDNKYDMPKGSLNRQSFSANYYYAFNGRRFSFPAAFTQSYLQRKSAGSWLLGAALQWRRTRITPGKDTPFQNAGIKTLNFAIGGGYGHNFCLNNKLMLHLSMLPTIVVFDHSTISGDTTKQKAKMHFPNFFVTSRAALLYSWKRNFAGVSGIADFANIGNTKHLEFLYLKWRVRFFYGFRF